MSKHHAENDVIACYYSAQRGQQSIADLESKRTSALRCNTEEEMYLINVQGVKGETGRQSDHNYLNTHEIFVLLSCGCLLAVKTLLREID